VGSCLFDDHQIWWRVEAETAEEALGHLPWYVAARTTAIRIAEVPILERRRTLRRGFAS
jgi:hypothetical protein